MLQDRIKPFLLACIFTGILFIIIILECEDNLLSSVHRYGFKLPAHKIRRGKKYGDTRGDKKLILFWTPLWDGFKGFTFDHCPVKNCENTFMRRDLDKSAAVIFPGRWPVQEFPTRRPAGQFWIYQNGESQERSLDLSKYTSFDGKINLTMTRLIESDFVTNGGSYRKRDHSSTARSYSLRPVLKRSKLLAWLVSNCETPSKREVYFDTLQKHIKADKFGKCSSTGKCPEKNCQEFITKHYKFYFAAENSLCKDYITEKVFQNAFYYDVVPVVYGGANYSKLLPPKSYIDVSDFGSAKKLAAYLKVLSRNDSLYMEYFQWREDYEPLPRNGVCDLCEFLNNQRGFQKVYKKMSDFWSKKDCISADEYMKRIL